MTKKHVRVRDFNLLSLVSAMTRDVQTAHLFMRSLKDIASFKDSCKRSVIVCTCQVEVHWSISERRSHKHLEVLAWFPNDCSCFVMFNPFSPKFHVPLVPLYAVIFSQPRFNSWHLFLDHTGIFGQLILGRNKNKHMEVTFVAHLSFLKNKTRQHNSFSQESKLPSMSFSRPGISHFILGNTKKNHQRQLCIRNLCLGHADAAGKTRKRENARIERVKARKRENAKLTKKVFHVKANNFHCRNLTSCDFLGSRTCRVPLAPRIGLS